MATKPKLNVDTSIVDYLKSTGKDSSFSSRSALAKQYGIAGYTGSNDQNIILLNKVKGTGTPAAPISSPTQVTSPNDANAFINSNQAEDFKIASSNNGDTPPVKSSTQSYQDLFNSLKTTIAPTKAPVAPDFTKQYKKLLETEGVSDLEATLSSLKNDAQVIKDANAARKAAEGDKPVAMNVIAGRQTEEDRQDQLKLDPINREIENISNQLTTKYKVVDNIMSYSKLDYATAVDAYDTQFTQNLNLFNVVKGIADDEKDDVERAEDNARANLQIIYNNISSGGKDISAISADEKASITKLELQAGLPVGFYSSLQSKNPKADILSTTTRDSNGTKYADVIMKNADGSLSIKSVTLGSTDKGGGGDGDLSLGEQKNQGFTEINFILDNSEATTTNGEPVKDSNGYITPAGFKQIVKFGATKGISRGDILSQYASDLYAGDDGDYPNYGLTNAEKSKLVSF